MRRKHVVKSAVRPAPGLETTVKRLAGKGHLHGCRTNGCSRTYEDNCQEPLNNQTCRPCRGRPAPIWDESRDPRPCCVDNTELVTSAHKVEAHQLAGPGPWFQCRACARCHTQAVTNLNRK